jgi:hypothetical protein
VQRRFFWVVSGAAMVGLLALPALSQQKTAKQCNDEWTANKAAIQASGKTKKDYVAECRGQTAAAPAPTAPASQPPSAAAPAPKTTTPAPKAAAKTGGPSQPSAGAAAGAGQFATEAEAKAHCATDTVVWANLDSKVYHFAGNRNYGKTKKGAYMCERDTKAAGIRAAKNEKHS